jgi:hypothetical protein
VAHGVIRVAEELPRRVDGVGEPIEVVVGKIDGGGRQVLDGDLVLLGSPSL